MKQNRTTQYWTTRDVKVSDSDSEAHREEDNPKGHTRQLPSFDEEDEDEDIRAAYDAVV